MSHPTPVTFPILFPLGLADISHHRPLKLQLHEWVKYPMHYCDSCFVLLCDTSPFLVLHIKSHIPLSQFLQIHYQDLTGNPHIVALYLMCKHHHLMETVLQHLNLTDDARMTDFWFHMKWQACGSSSSSFFFISLIRLKLPRSGRIHSFLWLKDVSWSIAIAVKDVSWSTVSTVKDVS